MKKITSLLLLAAALSACNKRAVDVEFKDATKGVATQKLKTNTVDPGSGVEPVYNSSLGAYTCNYGGAELVISPLPTNTDFNDGDMMLSTGISCTNCTSFSQAAGGYFVASIPYIPNFQLTDIHAKLSAYNTAFNEYVNNERDPITLEYKQQFLPSFPGGDSAFNGTVKGVIVRKHSSLTLAIIYNSDSFTPNPPMIRVLEPQ